MQAYARAVQAAIREIEAAASGVGRPSLSGGALQSRVQATQARAEAGLSSIAQSGVLNPTQLAGLTQGVRGDFERISQTLGVQLAGAERLRGAVDRANQSSAAASTAQERADRLREARAAREAERLAASATATAAGATGGRTRDERLAAQTETRLISTEATRRARLIDRGLDPDLSADRAAAEAAITAQRYAETQANRAARAEAQTARLARLDAEELEAKAKAVVAQARFTGAVSRQLSGQPGDVGTLGTAAADKGGLRARVQTVEAQTATSDDAEVKARAEALRARQALSAAVKREAGGADLAAAEQARAAAAQERDARALARKALANERAARQAELAAQQGTFAQRFQQRLGERGGEPSRPASSYATGPQLLGSGLVTSGRFLLSGALLYGALNTVQQLVRDSGELERVFNQIESQFRSADQAAEFPTFRKAVFDIARETGQAAKEVAFVGFQMQGAFGTGPGGAAYAIEQTSAAIKIARVTGLELGEVVDSLTAASKSFGISIEAVGDEALGLQERFGVLARESIKVFGDLGPAAASAGLNIREVGALIGAIQQVSGRSGSTIAEQLGRVLPAVGENAGKILQTYQDALPGRVARVGQELRAGQTGRVLLDLIEDWKNLSTAQQQQVTIALGGERQAATLNALFGHQAEILAELARSQADAGKTQSYFNDLQDTLAQKLAQAGQSLTAAGQALFEAGLGDVLKDLVAVGTQVLSIVGELAGGFATLNRATGGLAGKVLEVVLALKALQALAGLGAISSLLGAGGTIAGRFAAGAAPGVLAASVPGRAVGGVLGAAGLYTPAALATVGVAAVGSQYAKVRAENERAAATFAKQLDAATDDELRKLSTDRGNLVAQIGGGFQHLLGLTNYRDEIQDARRRRTGYAPIAAEAEAAQKAGLLSSRRQSVGVTGLPRTQSGEDILAAAQEGQESELKELERQLATIRRDPKKRARLEAQRAKIEAAAKQTAAQANAASVAADIGTSVEEAGNLYEAGLSSAAEYLQVLNNNATDLQGQLDALGTETEAGRDIAKQLAELRRKQAKLPSDLLRGAYDYENQVRDLAGTGGPEADIAGLTALLRNPTFTDRGDRVQATKDLVAAEKALLAERVAVTDDVHEQLRILQEGVELPVEARVELTQAAIDAYDSRFKQFLADATGSMEAANQATAEIVRRAVDNNVTIRQAAEGWIRDQENLLKAEIIRLTLGSWFGPGDNSAEIQKKLAEAHALEDSLSLGVPESLPVTGARVAGDASAVAAKEREVQRADEAAAREAEAAANKAKQEAEATARARFALRKAQLEGDPVGQAQAAIEEAQYMVASAETEADSLNAQAQLVSAQNQLARAQIQVQDAWRNLDRAMATAAGDTVRVAQIELEQAQAHLDAAQARGDVLGLAQARADQVSAQAAVTAAQLQAGKENIEFLKGMDQVTTGQEIAYYEALRQIPGLNKKQLEEITLKIHQLRKELSQDLQFNIPTEIDIPKLYEVRRATQMAAVGAGYQDNRTVAVQYNVLSPLDHQRALQDLVGVMTDAPRVGTQPRTYP